MSADEQKRRAAQAAAAYVKNGMILGLGTGSTASHLIDILGDQLRQGLTIRAIPTSEQSREQAQARGIPLMDPDETTQIDLAIDGADECDGGLNLIKGGGGALLREKIIADAAKKMIVIADISKKVAQLGGFPLPIEVERFSWSLSVQRIRTVLAKHGLGQADVHLRPGPPEGGGGVFRSDGGNYIIDVSCQRIADAALLDRDLRDIPGVIETGLFINLADLAIFGTPEGIETIGHL
ncbi:MAG: ribose-5-phosphate isomerase RpiA [bacterium]